MPEPNTSKALDAGEFFHASLKKAAKGVKKRIILSDLNSRGKSVCSEIPSPDPSARYAKSLLVTPERLVEDWPASDFEHLSAQHFEGLLALKPQIVLLGTGATLRFPRPELTRCLHTAQIGLEVMDNAAVCRTYNILTAEGRNVVAAVLLG